MSDFWDPEKARRVFSSEALHERPEYIFFNLVFVPLFPLILWSSERERSDFYERENYPEKVRKKKKRTKTDLTVCKPLMEIFHSWHFHILSENLIITRVVQEALPECLDVSPGACPESNLYNTVQKQCRSGKREAIGEKAPQGMREHIAWMFEHDFLAVAEAYKVRSDMACSPNISCHLTPVITHHFKANSSGTKLN